MRNIKSKIRGCYKPPLGGDAYLHTSAMSLSLTLLMEHSLGEVVEACHRDGYGGLRVGVVVYRLFPDQGVHACQSGGHNDGENSISECLLISPFHKFNDWYFF